jgi:hypothetical protein
MKMFDAILANAKKIRKTISGLAKVRRTRDFSDYDLSPQDFVAKTDELLGSSLRSISNALTKSEQGQGLAVFDLRQAHRQHVVGDAKPSDFRAKASEDPEVTKHKIFGASATSSGKPPHPYGRACGPHSPTKAPTRSQEPATA